VRLARHQGLVCVDVALASLLFWDARLRQEHFNAPVTRFWVDPHDAAGSFAAGRDHYINLAHRPKGQTDAKISDPELESRWMGIDRV
jgi:hypothetical protein